MAKKCFDIIIRYVPDRGWLPIIKDFKEDELFRGSFHPTAEKAVSDTMQYLPRYELEV